MANRKLLTQSLDSWKLSCDLHGVLLLTIFPMVLQGSRSIYLENKVCNLLAEKKYLAYGQTVRLLTFTVAPMKSSKLISTKLTIVHLGKSGVSSSLTGKTSQCAHFELKHLHEGHYSGKPLDSNPGDKWKETERFSNLHEEFGLDILKKTLLEHCNKIKNLQL